MGEAIALVTSYLGAIVVCVDINSIANENVVLEILKRGGQGFAYTCDVTSNEQVQRTVDVIERRVGEIAMYFHCCSVPSPRTYTTPAPPIQDTINLSLMSHFWVSLSDERSRFCFCECIDQTRFYFMSTY